MQLFKKYPRWNLARITRHILYWFLWTAFYVILNSLVKTHDPFHVWLSFELLVVPIKAGCAYVIAYWVLPKFLIPKKYLGFLIAATLTFLAFGVLLFLMYSQVIYPCILNNKDGYNTFGLEFLFKAIELVHISSLVVCIKFFQSSLYAEKDKMQLIQEKTDAELKYLKNQIQPHFLFNTLNNIYGMVLSKDEKAADTIIQLSDMLSYVLYDSEVEYTPLYKEIENMDAYIKMEQIRYDRKLGLSFDKNFENTELVIAPLLLLPFIENAFKHGPAKEEGRSFIHITASTKKEQFYFTVKNSYTHTAMDDSIKSGIGLANVRKRLELLYPDQYELTIDRASDFFTINLRIALDKISL